MICYHLAKFGDHKYCGSRDLFLHFTATWSDKTIGVSSDLARPWETIKVSYHPFKSGGHRNCGFEDIMASVCHVIFQEHVIKIFYDFLVKSPSR